MTFQPTNEGGTVTGSADPGSGAGTRRSTSVKDVAALAGVSLGTVSNLPNRAHRVAAGPRARVQPAMAGLGFLPNRSARQPPPGGSLTLAYVMLDATNPFFTDVA